MAKMIKPELMRGKSSYTQGDREKKSPFQQIVIDIPYPEDDWKHAFLVQLSKFPNVSRACQAARISRNTAYVMRRANAEFAALWEEIEEAATDQLVEKCWNRAMNSFDPGSATLAIFMLKSHRPAVYNPPRIMQAQHNYTTKDGEPMQITIQPVNYQNYIAELAPPDADAYTDEVGEDDEQLQAVIRQEILMQDSTRV